MFSILSLLGISEKEARELGERIGRIFAELNEFFVISSDVLDKDIERCEAILKNLEEKNANNE
ncbi:MAG TPA: hypothetical protein DCG38_05090 [Eubacteriaceae bacterium]|nr:hypothetical protein [Eubacteriaceae bacterium]